MAADELSSVGIIPLLLIFFIIAFLWIRSRRPSDLPPGPVPLPVLGNILYLVAGDLRKVSESVRKKYGSLFSLSLGPHWVIFVNGIDTLKDVLWKRRLTFLTDQMFTSSHTSKQGKVWLISFLSTFAPFYILTQCTRCTVLYLIYAVILFTTTYHYKVMKFWIDQFLC